MVGGKDAPKINLNLHDTANACSSTGVLGGDCLATKVFIGKLLAMRAVSVILGLVTIG